MTELLFNDQVLATVVIASMTVVVISAICLRFGANYLSDAMQKFLLYLLSVSAAMLVCSLAFTSQIRYHTAYESDWRQVYTNDAKAEITLEADDDVSFKAGARKKARLLRLIRLELRKQRHSSWQTTIQSKSSVI